MLLSELKEYVDTHLKDGDAYVFHEANKPGTVKPTYNIHVLRNGKNHFFIIGVPEPISGEIEQAT